jgi:hypothetical protein
MFIKVDLTDLLSAQQKDALLDMLRILAELDSDRTQVRNGVGFNREDSELGHDLSELEVLSPSEAEAAKAILRKYHRQLPSELYDMVYGTPKKPKLEPTPTNIQHLFNDIDIEEEKE